MRKILTFLLLVLVIAASVVPTAAVIKEVNNDRKADDSFLDDCDDGGGWAASGGIVDEEEATEGFASILFTKNFKAHSNENWTIRGFFNEEDLREKDYVQFDIYLSHPELITSTYQISVALGSGHKWNEWHAAMFTEYVEGWNTIKLPLQNSQTKNADLSEINGFRLEFKEIGLSEDVDNLELRIDNIQAYTYATRAIMLNGCDTMDYWSAVDRVETIDHTQGVGALVFTTVPVSAGGDGNMIRECLMLPTNCANADFLEFDFYVSDASALDPNNCLGYGRPHDVMFEITSSGRCDSEEYQFALLKDFGKLKDGWNHIKFALPKTATDPPDMRRINYFRFFILAMQECKNDKLTIMLDNIYLSVKDDGIEDYAPQPGENPDMEDPEMNENPGNNENQGDTGANENPGADNSQENVTSMKDKALTMTRAKSVIVVFGFAIIGINIAVAAVRKRSLALITAEGTAPDAAEMAQAAEQPSFSETSADGNDSDTTT